eukprot:CAMPEP_0202034010 /NCGR_PEP_ID=MMETSP0905-20130828/66342_1 /ASSEMBLY_ACC=CAM_ASM_000554 /TAXON_ID=420261 /ORGANISM="Thalassiosira antarctica, Strain CCMP982" /LENGTH=436 /DNA_ID=CAMNT_0048597925 /DNA_START=11 /DNA_END=1321 /DNA_ORIENTATION=-
MKFAFLTATACILAETAHAQISAAPGHLRGWEKAADSEFGAVSSMSFSMTTNNESFVIASSSSGGRGGGSKSRKSGKAGKNGKKRNQSLIATLALLESPERATADATAHAEISGPPTKPSGTVSLNYNPDGSFLLSLDAAGLSGGFVAISSGTSCSDIGPGPYYDDNSMSDPWFGMGFSPRIVYEASEEGFSNGAWRVDNGFGSQENDGHAFIMFDGYGEGLVVCGVLGVAGDRMLLAAEMDVYPGYEGGLNVAGSVRVTYRKDGTFKFRYNLEGLEADCELVVCGVLGVAGDRMLLAAEMDVYPGYTGSHVVTGDVRVTYRKDDTFKFRYNLKGLEADCEGCGIHIHEGTSCDSHELVKGHYWDDEVVEDLWTTAGGATYDSDAEGNAEGYFNVYNGYSFGKNVGHAVVVHAQSGARVACGVLEGIVHESEMGNL